MVLQMNNKEKVVMRLDGKTVIDFMEEYYKIENDILGLLSEKKNWNILPCDCKDVTVSFICVDPDNNEAILRLCAICGGDLN